MKQIDTEVLTKCQNGDKAAFRVIVQTYQRMVFSLGLKFLCDEEEAKDVVQETFIKVWVNIRRYDGTSAFSTWIYGIVTNLCLDRLRKSKRLIPFPEDESVLREYATCNDSQHKLENAEWVAILRLLTDKLSEKQRLVFTLSHLEGLDTQEISSITGMDAKHIKDNLYVARQTIRKQLKRLGYE